MDILPFPPHCLCLPDFSVESSFPFPLTTCGISRYLPDFPWSHLGRPLADDDHHHHPSPPAGVSFHCPRLFPLYLQQYSLLYPGFFVSPRGMTSSTLYQCSIQVSPFVSPKGGGTVYVYTLIASIAYKWSVYLATVPGHSTKYLPRVKRQEMGCICLQLLHMPTTVAYAYNCCSARQWGDAIRAYAS